MDRMSRLARHLFTLCCALPVVGCAAQRPTDGVDVTLRPEYQLFYRSGDVYEVVGPVQIARPPKWRMLDMCGVPSNRYYRSSAHPDVLAIAPLGTRVRVERLIRSYEEETSRYTVHPEG